MSGFQTLKIVWNLVLFASGFWCSTTTYIQKYFTFLVRLYATCQHTYLCRYICRSKYSVLNPDLSGFQTPQNSRVLKRLDSRHMSEIRIFLSSFKSFLETDVNNLFWAELNLEKLHLLKPITVNVQNPNNAEIETKNIPISRCFLACKIEAF